MEFLKKVYTAAKDKFMSFHPAVRYAVAFFVALLIALMIRGFFVAQ